MKTYFAMLLLAAVSSIGAVACVGAPEEGVESTAAPVIAEPASAEAEGLKAKDIEVGFMSAEEAHAKDHDATYGSCTAAELAACRRADPYGSGCLIYNGRVECLYE